MKAVLVLCLFAAAAAVSITITDNDLVPPNNPLVNGVGQQQDYCTSPPLGGGSPIQKCCWRHANVPVTKALCPNSMLDFQGSCCATGTTCCFNTLSNKFSCCAAGMQCQQTSTGAQCRPPSIFATNVVVSATAQATAANAATVPAVLTPAPPSCLDCVQKGKTFLSSVSAGPANGRCINDCLYRGDPTLRLCTDAAGTAILCNDAVCHTSPMTCPVAEFTNCPACTTRGAVWNKKTQTCSVTQCLNNNPDCAAFPSACPKKSWNTCPSCVGNGGVWASGIGAGLLTATTSGCLAGPVANLQGLRGPAGQTLTLVATSAYNCPGTSSATAYAAGTCNSRCGSIGYNEVTRLGAAAPATWAQGFANFIGYGVNAGFCSCDANCAARTYTAPAANAGDNDCCVDKTFFCG